MCISSANKDTAGRDPPCHTVDLLHSHSLSPAIDAGVDVGLEKDIAGTIVPQGKAPDIGAYEFTPPPAEGGK